MTTSPIHRIRIRFTSSFCVALVAILAFTGRSPGAAYEFEIKPPPAELAGATFRLWLPDGS